MSGQAASHRTRTAVVALLAAVVGVRVSIGHGLQGPAATVAGDPGSRIARSLDGWSSGGTLGDASAADLRSLPLALLHRAADTLGLSDVTAQAVWTSVVLLLAVVGAQRLAAASDVAADGPGDEPAPWTPWAAGLVYACGPVVVATAVDDPLDGLVAAVLPWVLLPLVRRDGGWAGAARSAAWLGLVGVGSASWSLVALAASVVAAACVWRSRPGPLLRWALLAVLACSWWVAVLVWEAARALTVTGVLPEVGPQTLLAQAVGRPTWGLAWLVLLVLGPVAVAVAGLVALRRPVDQHRSTRDAIVPPGLLVALLAVGAVPLVAALAGLRLPVLASAAVAGEPSAVAPSLAVWGAATLLAWGTVVDRLQWRADDLLSLPRSASAAAALVAAFAVVVSAVGVPLAALERPEDPTTAGSSATAGGEGRAVWRAVAAWSREAPAGRVLVLPATPGRLDPEIGRALAGRPWIGRDALPASGARATAAIDDVLRRVARGQAGAEVLDGLRRLGVTYVLLRQDLGATEDRRRPAGLVRAALTATGAQRQVSLSPPDQAGESDVVLDAGLRSTTPRVEVWRLPSSSLARVASDVPLEVAGDAGSTADLVASGLLGDRAVRLVDRTDEGGVVSDSAYRRDVDQREAVDPDGPALTARAPRHVVPPGAAAPPTAVRRLDGVRSVTASTSAAQASGDSRRPGAEPVAAIDGNPFTVWQSRPGAREGQWWQLDLDDPVRVAGTVVQVVQNLFGGQRVTRVRVTTDAGAREMDVPSDGRLLVDDPGPTSRLRITALSFSGSSSNDGFGIAEVSVPGLDVRDDLVIDGIASTWVLAARPASQVRCVPAPAGVGAVEVADVGALACDPSLSVRGRDVGALERVVRLDRARSLSGRAWVQAPATAQAALVADDLADPSIRATGTSVAAVDLTTRAQAAVDGDPTTAWRASAADQAPGLTLGWDRPAVVRGLRLSFPRDGLSARPGRVRVELAAANGRTRTVERGLADDGSVGVPRTRARGLTLTLLDLDGPTSVDSTTAAERRGAPALSEVEIVGGPATTYDADSRRTLDCGQGPDLTVGRTGVATRVRASARDVVEGRPVLAFPCDDLEAPEGATPVTLEATFTWLPLGLVLATDDGGLGDVGEDRDGEAAGMAMTPVDLESVAHRWSSARVQVPGTGPRTVVLAVPRGSEWVARADGRRLAPVTVDGWAQGYVVPAGVGGVDLAYEAGSSLRWGVGLGVLGWVAVLGLAVGVVARPLGRRSRDHARVGRSTQA